jgi:hypothetical protein
MLLNFSANFFLQNFINAIEHSFFRENGAFDRDTGGPEGVVRVRK